MTERDGADALLIAAGFRPVVERFRETAAKTGEQRASAEREVVVRLERERSEIARGLADLAVLRDDVVAMANAVASDPDTKELSEEFSTVPATVHEGTPASSLRDIHARIGARIKTVMPGLAIGRQRELPLGGGSAEGAATGTAARHVAGSSAQDAVQENDDSAQAAGSTRVRSCHHCGTEIPLGVEVCPSCNRRVKLPGSSWGSERAPSASADSRAGGLGCATTSLGLLAIVAGFVILLNVSPVLVSRVEVLCQIPIVSSIIPCDDGQRGFRQAPGGSPLPRTSGTPSSPSSSRLDASERWHVVSRGETLSSIAGRENTTVARLMELNADTVPDPDRIEVGDRIRLP